MKRIRDVLADPFVPEAFGRNQRGMQAGADVPRWKNTIARWLWLGALYVCAAIAWLCAKLDIHKQWANRLLELWSWQTVIVSSTEWENFFALRCHPDAQPEFQKIAWMMRRALSGSTPKKLEVGEWHLPYVSIAERALFYSAALPKISVARCARVSYLTHAGVRDPEEDIRLYQKLVMHVPPHASPLEHAARVDPREYVVSNFDHPWQQHRKDFE